jgi:hypothetical protein
MAVQRTAKGAGKVALPVAPTGALWARLGNRGSATVRVRVTYTPITPGAVVAASRSKQITLIKSQ